ncbi:sulfotransferase [Luteolibacter ambystomatis]|uniref:Sulfotransferase n=1 Tax=Luteolibacter ambystomatis TaxID=2824561 RepID=A0A975J1S6_9BACT|nr:tetratricopeptide repeat-containing sulfotransferase family protein [Luteolibacter ambystomatis]QUE52431.1 sulfotransferase [Luteolibacter ambystomatis]
MAPSSGVQDQDLYTRAKRAEEEGDLDHARVLYQAALTHRPNDPSLLQDFAALLWMTYDFTAAGRLHERLASLPMEDPTPLLWAARAEFSIGHFDRAARLLDVALASHPDNADLLGMLASVHERAHHGQEAREMALRALAIDPTHAEATRLIAHLDVDAGDLHAARTRLVNQLQQHPGDEDWRLRYELAAIFDRMGEPQAVMRELNKAKASLYPQALPALDQSRRIRERQWALTCRITDEDWKRWQTGLPEDASHHPVALMGGFPRSGATLVEHILTKHPRCLGTDESGILFSQFTRPLVHQAASMDDAFETLNNLSPTLLVSDRERYIRCTEALLGESLEGRVLLDREPFHTADLPLPLRLFPESRVLMPLRDPRDAVISYFLTLVPMAPDSAASVDLGETCRFYADTMRHWLHLEAILPHPTLRVRYEDLIVQPEQTIREVTSFLGLPWSPDLIAGESFHADSIGRWKLYEPWLARHMHHLDPFIEAFGYAGGVC